MDATLSATDRVRQARAALVISQPFFGTLALYLELHESTRLPDGRPCETMATDGRRLYFSPAFVAGLSDLEMQGCVAHEVEHCARMHHTRRGARDREIWNEAADYAINGGLLAVGFRLPASAPVDRAGEYAGLNAEGIYSVLFGRRSPAVPASGTTAQEPGEESDAGEDAPGSSSSGEDDSAGEDSSGDAGELADGDGEADPNGGPGAGDPGEDGDAPGEATAPAGGSDGPGEADSGASGDASGPGAPSGASPDPRNCDPGACGEILDAAPDYEPAEAAAIESEWQARVQVALAVAKAAGAGTLPGHLASIADDLIAPRIDPAETFRRFVDQSQTRDYSWSRPSRRFAATGLYLPGAVAVRPSHIVALVDTSGSITKTERDAFAGFLQEALDAGAADRLTVAYADTDIQLVREYEPGDTLDLDAPMGGGTAFRRPLAWVGDECPDASAIAYLTDCDASDYGQEPAAPVLWLVTGDPRTARANAARAPFGEAVLFGPALLRTSPGRRISLAGTPRRKPQPPKADRGRMTMESTMRNYLYRVDCDDSAGWDYWSLWGNMADESDRLYATAREAHAAARELMAPGDWNGFVPTFRARRVAVHEYLWGNHRESVIDRVCELANRDRVTLADMPVHVARYLVDLYRGAGRVWSRESARLAGASSATHTAAVFSALAESRADEVRTVMAARGIALT